MEKLHPKAVWLFFFIFVFRLLFLLVLLGFIFGPMLVSLFKAKEIGVNFLLIPLLIFGLPILMILAVYLIFCYIWARLTYRFWRYELAESALKIEKGVIWKKYISIPYERIQNVDIYRGVLTRLLGLSDLQVQTAGYSAVYGARGGGFGFGAEGRLPGLTPDVAEGLRENLTQRVAGARQKQGL